MQSEEVKSLIEKHLPDCRVLAEGGGGKFEVVVIGDCFQGLNAVKKQQLVYGALTDQISDGSVHAVTIKTFTLVDWNAQNN